MKRLAVVLLGMLWAFAACSEGGIVDQVSEERESVKAKEELAVVVTKDIEGITFVYVPAGDFTMGSLGGDGDTDEQPQHTVYLDEFWIGQMEVTNAQYARCVEAGDCPEPNNSRWNEIAFADHPVTDVSWDDAVAYARWLGEVSGIGPIQTLLS